jgi:hypothetical protein
MVSTDPALAVGTLLPAHPPASPASGYDLLPCAGTPFALAVETDGS